MTPTGGRRCRLRDAGLVVGSVVPGPLNALTDVPGVAVGHQTIIRGDSVRTGVTAILPHDGNIYQEKVPAAIWVGNGFGKLAGYTQVDELGNLETPIVLTNTLSVSTAVTTLVKYTLNQSGNESVRSVNAVVGETNDGGLNDVRGMHVSEEDVLAAIGDACSGSVAEGCVGAGTGTVALGFKGGIGTASRRVPLGESRYTVGVLVQTNFGGSLEINGMPVGQMLAASKQPGVEKERGDGSCMVVVATDAPLDTRNLKRLASRAIIGLGKTGSYLAHGSGDYVIAFSTAYRISAARTTLIPIPPLLSNESMTPLFQAVIESTQEAIYNSLFMAETMSGIGGRTVHALSVDDVIGICRRPGVAGE